MEWLDLIAQVSGSAIRFSVPLLFACLAGLYSERAGVFDIGLEGKMLIGAFTAGTVAALTGSAWLGLLGAVLASVFFALVHGFASITHRGNQIVSGVAINFIAAGLTAQLGQTWFKIGGQTPQLDNDARFMGHVWPFADSLRGVPVLGQVYSQILSGQNILVYAAFLAVPLTWWLLFRTRFGLRLRAVGENPAAVDTAGISVEAMRYAAVMCCGVLCGFAGAYLSIAQSAGFIEYMTAGKGFIALAADSCDVGVSSVRDARCRLHSPARRADRRDRHRAGATHAGRPLYIDRHFAGGLHRPCRGAKGGRRALCEGKIMAQTSLIAAAVAARLKAYAPYSRFLVGAAVKDEHGMVHAGCNVENAAYPEGVCAEAGAIAAMIMAGGRRIAEAAVVGAGDALVTPCGGCRQKLREFGAPGLVIHVCDETGKIRRSFTLAELLPESFGPENLSL